MATTKITITLPDDQVHAIRDLVAAKKSASVSGFVQHAVSIALSELADWQIMLDDALQQTGGPLTQAERDWVDGVAAPNPNQRPESKPGLGRSSTRRNKAA